MSGLRRVIVGASGSPGNLCALRYAEHLARASGATLIPVHAWMPPGGDLADWRCPSLYLRRVWTESALTVTVGSALSQPVTGMEAACRTVLQDWDLRNAKGGGLNQPRRVRPYQRPSPYGLSQERTTDIVTGSGHCWGRGGEDLRLWLDLKTRSTVADDATFRCTLSGRRGRPTR